MTITSIVSVWVNCDAQDKDPECHITIEIDFNSVLNHIDQEGYEDWLSDAGWLVLGEMAYCPVCKKQIMS